jgi:type II secretory pathway component GspD/PulD (secretin)
MEPGDVTAITGSFGSLLNLNFDAITIFGYTFSARLNAALSENRAQVFADTTLHGISGENVKFQNTSTYRYRDSNVDATTGKPVYTGITREIVSGVTLEINGWVSGEGMVTMGINASVSKRGADVTTANGNPPATSEKIIATKLSTADGEPVILSGLEQNDTSIVEQRTPIISRIPLIGWLFMNYGETKQKSEMVIYLVPHITNGKDRSEERDTLERTAIERLVAPVEARRKK